MFENKDPRARGYFIHLPGSSTKSHNWRDVPLTPELFKRLTRYAETEGRKRDDCIFIGKRRRASGRVEPLTASGVQQLTRHLAREAHISQDAGGRHERVYPHLFRHSFVTNMLDPQKGNISPAYVMAVVGHSSSELVMEVCNQLQAQGGHNAVIAALKKW